MSAVVEITVGTQDSGPIRDQAFVEGASVLGANRTFKEDGSLCSAYPHWSPRTQPRLGVSV